jgi:protein-tyrosine phosphatase
MRREDFRFKYAGANVILFPSRKTGESEKVWVIQWAKSLTENNEFDIPIRNFGKVVDTVYRGALPDAEGYRALTEKLGVYRVCSIIEQESQEDRKCALNAGIKEWRCIPFSDKDAPPANRVGEWLDYIRTSKKKGSIFTHCRGGRHRTGTLVAVYRVTDCGWTKEQAFEEMKKYGWYSALGHKPLKDWFFEEFDPKDYQKESQ